MLRDCEAIVSLQRVDEGDFVEATLTVRCRKTLALIYSETVRVRPNCAISFLPVSVDFEMSDIVRTIRLQMVARQNRRDPVYPHEDEYSHSHPGPVVY